MHQIRASLQVILKEVTKQEAIRNLRMFTSSLAILWGLNQVGSLVILLYYFDVANRELYFQALGMALATIVFAYQLI